MKVSLKLLLGYRAGGGKAAIPIDVGSAATDRAGVWGGGTTTLAKDNPCDTNGTITNIDIFANATLTNCKVGVFYQDGGSGIYTCRSSAVLGTVGVGLTHNAVSLAVQTGDLIGFFCDGVSLIEATTSGGAGLWYIVGDAFGLPGSGYTSFAGYDISLYGTGLAS